MILPQVPQVEFNAPWGQFVVIEGRSMIRDVSIVIIVM